MEITTWAGFFQIVLLASSFFGAGWLWREESAYREEEQRAARRRAHRLRSMNQIDSRSR